MKTFFPPLFISSPIHSHKSNLFVYLFFRLSSEWKLFHISSSIYNWKLWLWMKKCYVTKWRPMGRIWRASRFESANCDVENGIFCLAVFWDFRYCSEMRKEWIWLYWSHVSHSRTSLHSSVCHADEENIWKTAFQALASQRCRSHAGGSK